MKSISIYSEPCRNARRWFETLDSSAALLKPGSNEEYFAAFESTFNCTLQLYQGCALPASIEFADDKCYTMFMLKWA